MTARTENSVLIALADVIDLERARARREAERRAAEQAEALAQQEAAARRAREEAQAAARLAAEAAERRARQEAERVARLEQEARFQSLVATRVATIAAQGEREIAELREAYAARPSRRRGSWAMGFALAACLLMVGAVGCLVGTTLQGTAGQAATAPTATAPTPRTPKASLAVDDLTWASQLEQPRLVRSTRGSGWAYAARPTTWRPRPRVTTPAVTTPTVSCAQLGPLGCLRD